MSLSHNAPKACKRCGAVIPFGEVCAGIVCCLGTASTSQFPFITQAGQQPFKDDSAKLPMHLLPVDPVQDVVKVLAFGAKKYAANAWREGIAWTRIIDAAERHIASWKKGDDYDKESGLNHLAHAACNLLFLLEYERTATRLDDRYRASDNTHRTLHDCIDGGPCRCGGTHTLR